MVLSKDEFDTVINMKELIMSNEFTHRYFFSFDDQTEIHSQLPIYFEYKDLKCKALMDGVIIDHRNKLIQPYDLKSTGKSVYSFEEWIPIYGYHRQAAFYMIALKEWLKEKNEVAIAFGDDSLEDYTILPFRFIVVESKLSSKMPAIVYELSDHDMECGLNGGVPCQTKRYVKGINELIRDYKWHLKHDKWDLRKELYESEGIKITNIFKRERNI